MIFRRKFKSDFFNKEKESFYENKFRSDFYYERECHFYKKDLDLIFII